MEVEPKDSFYDIVVKSSARGARANSLGRVSYDPRGGDEDIRQAQWRMSEDNVTGGINCSYYDYPSKQELTNIVLKLSRN